MTAPLLTGVDMLARTQALSAARAPGLATSRYKRLKPLFNFNATDFAAWSTRSTGITYSLDTYQGQPCVKMAVAANFASGSGGLASFGVPSALIDMPTGWDGSDLIVGFASDNITTGCSQVNVNVGDASFTNFYQTNTGPDYNGYYESSFKYAAGDVLYYHTRGGTKTTNNPLGLSWTVGAGSPTYTGTKQINIRPTIKAGNPAFTMYLTLFAVGGKPRRATGIFTFDDGWADQYNEVVPRCRYYGIPATFNVVGSLIDTTNYMTTAQLAEIVADDSGLFAVCNHTYNHIPFNTRVANVGDTQARADMVADFNLNRDWLVARGVGESAIHGAWPQSEFNRQLILDMQTAGYKSMRAASVASSHKCTTMYLGDRGAFGFGSDTEMQTGVAVSDFTDRITLAKAQGETIWFEGHKFRSAVGANQWTPALLDSLMSACAAERDAGTMEFATQPQWYANNVSNVVRA